MLFHTRIIAVSRAVLSQFPGTLRMRRKATVVHNGVSTQVYSNFNTVVPEWKKTGVQLVSIGELHTTKNHALAIKAIESFSKEFIEKYNVTYHIIGEGAERKHIEARIEKSHLKNRIYMYGALPNASQYMPSFDICILSSISEAFCYVVVEAGRAGLPVIATRVGGVPEIIKDDVSGLLVRSKSIEEMAKAMQDLIVHKTKRIKLAAALKARVQKEFSVEQMIEGTMKVYAKLGEK
jgi:glycosyltransferase involved in cell wall biosynthesis